MNKFLVTGRAGAGKSTVQKRLAELHYNSFDTDNFPGLASWRDLSTGQLAHVDPGGFVDYSKVGWNWNAKVLKGILGARKLLFLCGSASNELEFHHLFDKVFVLQVDPETQLNRLQTRESTYGKDPAMQAEIIREQAEFVKQAIQLGATAIDNTRPINEVVSEILSLVNET